LPKAESQLKVSAIKHSAALWSVLAYFVAIFAVLSCWETSKGYLRVQDVRIKSATSPPETDKSSKMAPATASSSSYLLPLPKQPQLEPDVARVLQEIESQFALGKEQLDKTVKQMLWEFGQGLSKHADESNIDTFLPMM